MNVLAFNGTNFVFSQLTYHGEKERKRHDLALEKLQRVSGKWNEHRVKRVDFINKRLREANKARVYISNVDDAILEDYRIFGKQIKPLAPESQLSDFYQLSETQKNGELLIVVVGSVIAIYALYKYLK